MASTFDQVADCLKFKNAKIARKAVKRPSSGKFDLIQVGYVEHLTTEQVAAFLAKLVVHKGISAKTANHYRVNLLTMCNWAKDEGGVRFPVGKNPIGGVKRYKESKRDISFLKLGDIVPRKRKMPTPEKKGRGYALLSADDDGRKTQQTLF